MEELAQVYARSLFQVAREQGKLDELREQLAQFADALDEHRQLAVFFFSPYFSTAEKQEALGRVLEGADEILLNFLALLIENHRMPVIFRIRDEYPGLTSPRGGLQCLRRGCFVGDDRLVVECQPGGRQERQAADAAVKAQEVLDVTVRGRSEQPLRRFDLGELAAGPEDGDLVPDLDRLLNIVRNEHDGLVQVGLQPDELVLQACPDDRVHGTERLVHQQHRRIRGQRARDTHALLLPA